MTQKWTKDFTYGLMLSDALSAISYWATIEDVTVVKGLDSENPEEKFPTAFKIRDLNGGEYTVDFAVLDKGFDKLARETKRLGCDKADRYVLTFCIQWIGSQLMGDYMTIDYDAEILDMAIQYGLLDELVYG